MIKARTWKNADEEFPIGFRLTSPDLEDGETIATCVCTVSPSGLDITELEVINGPEVSQFIKSGVAGVSYEILFTITTSTDKIWTPIFKVEVK